MALGPVNQVTQEGLPVLFIQDLPPRSETDLAVDQPSIYFGELSNDYVLVNTGTDEFHYPEGENNVSTRYDGSGGVEIGSLFRRLLFSLRFRSYEILVSGQLDSDSPPHLPPATSRTGWRPSRRSCATTPTPTW